MNKLPIEIAHSDVHFALRGCLNDGFHVLVISEGCPLSLRNAMPGNSAGRMSGCLSPAWFNFLKPGYQWAYSGVLPEFVRSVGLTHARPNEPGSDSPMVLEAGFQPGSRLQFAWRAFSNTVLRLNHRPPGRRWVQQSAESPTKTAEDREAMPLVASVTRFDVIARGAPANQPNQGFSTHSDVLQVAAWKAGDFRSQNGTLKVQSQLDRQAPDLSKAILVGNVNSIADIIAPIILECGGYSTED